MDTNSQYQNPNPKTDPDQYITNRLFDDSLYFEVSDYFVMDNGSEEDIFVENTIPPAENVVNESSHPSPVASNMQVQLKPNIFLHFCIFFCLDLATTRKIFIYYYFF